MKDSNGKDVPPEPVPTDSEIDEQVRRVRQQWLVSDKAKQRRQGPGRANGGGRGVEVEIKRSSRQRNGRP